ncbi:Energy-coupling factor transporter transmembrane protein BioN [Sulfitobacter sp. THAF37]|uniref:energy-coupling factor transporter transmembrane component T family protein n=1 Tax=Sulfitobacter sp. THAF37 TaxID=2587855 RepID=UPI001269518C|nr:energy-coupling factor transporter transmembrane protein EcfT [Sulfitobacter sp. THAF37]QFT58678.1 Energy-coupling factor transporter transmembrane protein BioN [Sulfitobacter sp. THAF37]
MISLTSPVETRAHGWPAGAKLIALCGAIVVLFATDTLVPHAIYLCLTLGLYALPGRRFLRTGMSRLRPLWIFAAVILIWHVVTSDPMAGLVIVLRMVTAVALANLVTMTTRLTDMMAVVRWLLTPLRRFGLRTEAVELAMALVIRFTPVLAEKGHMLTLAWRARAVRRVGWHIVTPLAALAIDDAEHVAEALRARGGVAATQVDHPGGRQ